MPVAYGLQEFGGGIGPIVRDNVQCNGTESKLTDCPANHFHDCRQIENAGVNCCGAPGMNQLAPTIKVQSLMIFIASPDMMYVLYIVTVAGKTNQF